MQDRIDCEQTAAGVIVPVLAQPGARQNGILGVHAGRLKVAVTQVAERGKANAALCKVLAEELGVKRSQVKLVSGANHPHKRFLIADTSVAHIVERVGAALNGQ